ncbi:hypothetical protein [Sulfurihydrogenibium sp.]|uniref:hypothetical protein n=1 Tax=Sulfurihydrogenibium sp. TaxID=2053621 RepID=UPI00262B7F57|nr:hypothetical protein [Sulfurihydrogenibium sp.]
MKLDIKEIAYKIYEESLNENYEPFEKVNNQKKVWEGDIFFTILKNKPVFFLVLRQISEKYYECLKLSSFYEFATPSDVYYRSRFDNQLFIIETDVNFYLSEDEILKKSVYLETVEKEFLEKIKKYREGEKQEIETGFEYPFGNRWVEKFKENELKIIKEYHLRIFDILDQMEESSNIISIAPERLEKYTVSLAASSENKTAIGENFILYKEVEHGFINIILPKEFINKKVRIYMGKNIIFENVLDDNVIALQFDKVETLDLDSLKKDIKVEVLE